jgi:hypothetical protein
VDGHRQGGLQRGAAQAAYGVGHPHRGDGDVARACRAAGGGRQRAGGAQAWRASYGERVASRCRARPLWASANQVARARPHLRRATGTCPQPPLHCTVHLKLSTITPAHPTHPMAHPPTCTNQSRGSYLLGPPARPPPPPTPPQALPRRSPPMPRSLFKISWARITEGRLSSGSPMPMNTTLDTRCGGEGGGEGAGGRFWGQRVCVCMAEGGELLFQEQAARH